MAAEEVPAIKVTFQSIQAPTGYKLPLYSVDMTVWI